MKGASKRAVKKTGRGVNLNSAEVPERKADEASNRALDAIEALLWIMLVAAGSWLGWVTLLDVG